MMSTRTRCMLTVLMLTSSACFVGPGGGFESLSGSDEEGDADDGDADADGDAGGDDAADDPFPPLEDLCDFDYGANPVGVSVPCSADEQCCAEEIAPVGLLGDAACASASFPNNWQCESGTCRQRWTPSADEGCTSDDDCRFGGFVCHTISGVGHCVAPCNNDIDCANDHNMPDSDCLQPAGASIEFCMQTQP